MELKDARVQIDAVDTELAKLLVKRFDICCEVARIKMRDGLPVLHPAREDEVAARMAELGKPYGDEIAALFREIMKTSVQLQKDLMAK